MTHLPDVSLLEYATPRQAEIIKTVLEMGSISGAARALNIKRSGVQLMIKMVKTKAAMQGDAIEHGLGRTIAFGYTGKGHSTLDRVSPNGERQMVLQWTKTKADEVARMQALEAALVMAGEDLPRVKPLPAPKHYQTDIMNVMTFTDYHLGMAARAAETGADWDLQIAEKLCIAAAQDMISRAPRARKMLLNIQGDFLHFDSKRPVTPTHGHVLDASGSYSHMVEVGIRVIRALIDLALQTHQEVEVVMCQGNHDLASMVLFRHAFTAIYEREPRVTINASETPYYVVEFGLVMVGIHHGHMKKNEGLPLLFAARYAAIWGRTTKRYGLAGHRHHEERKEHAGMKIFQLPTLAPNDNHSSDGGWDSEREASLFTFHAKFGRIGETVFTPEMVDLKLAA